MRILFTSWGGRSHLLCLIPLAQAMRSAGHDVVVASQPVLRSTIERAGLTAVIVGHDLDVGEIIRRNLGYALNTSARPPGTTPEDQGDVLVRKARLGLGHFVDLALDMAPELLAFARDWRPECVVFEPASFVGPIIAAAVGALGIRHLWGPDYLYRLDEVSAGLLEPLTAMAGIGPVRALGEATVDTMPDPMRTPSPGVHLPMRHVPYNGPAVVTDPAAAETSRVCFTFGYSQAGLGTATPFDLDAMIVGASESFDEVVLLGVTQDLVEGLPGNVRVMPPAALHLVLEKCSAVVHHGGSGTMMTALAAGVPQLAVTSTPDAAFNGRVIVDHQLGGHLPPEEQQRGDLGAVVRCLRDDVNRAGASAMAERHATMPTPASVVRRIEELVAAGV